MQRALMFSAILLAVIAPPAASQLISVRTIPIAQADQFVFLPSRNAGLGGISIALPDSLGDVGMNPALGARIGATQFFSAPFLYVGTNSSGSGQTMPVGVMASTTSWFGHATAAAQNLDTNRPPGTVAVEVSNPSDPLKVRGTGNQFFSGSMGRRLGHGLSVGASGAWSKVRAIDLVDRMYAGSRVVNQAGSILDLRFGALKEAGIHSFEGVLLHNRYRVDHIVTYVDNFFDAVRARNSTRSRVVNHHDYHDTWGAQFSWTRPLSDTTLRVGLRLIGNRMSHPKLPEYEFAAVQTIPWDPGHTNALSFGFGFAKRTRQLAAGIEVAFEPIWTHTWAEAPAEVVSQNGVTIPAGGRTLENWFHFGNLSLRGGWEWRFKPVAVQFGVDMESVSYRFWQADLVRNANRTSDEAWVAATPTWGLRFSLAEAEIRYQGRVTKGLGRPGATGDARFAADVAQSSGGGTIVSAPTDATINPADLMVHQITISVPLGRVVGEPR